MPHHIYTINVIRTVVIDNAEFRRLLNIEIELMRAKETIARLENSVREKSSNVKRLQKEVSSYKSKINRNGDVPSNVNTLFV